jgi:hypothetical protein
MYSPTFTHYKINIERITHDTIDMLSKINDKIKVSIPITRSIFKPQFDKAHEMITLDKNTAYYKYQLRKLPDETKAERIVRYLCNFACLFCLLKEEINFYEMNFSYIVKLQSKPSNYDKIISRIAKELGFVVNNLNQELQSQLTRIIPFVTTNREVYLLLIQEWLLFRGKIMILSKKSKNLLEEIMPNVPSINNKPVAYLLNHSEQFSIDIHNTGHNVLLRRLIS